MFKRNDRKIKKENYYILLGMLGITILLGLLITKINYSIQNNRIKKSPLANIVNKYEYNNIEKALSNDDFFFMFSYTKNEDVYNLEKKIAKLVKDNKLEKMFYYVDLTDYRDQNKIFDEINIKLNTNLLTNNSLPTILYYREGKLISVLNSRSNYIFNDGELYKILDMYGLIK